MTLNWKSALSFGNKDKLESIQGKVFYINTLKELIKGRRWWLYKGRGRAGSLVGRDRIRSYVITLARSQTRPKVRWRLSRWHDRCVKVALLKPELVQSKHKYRAVINAEESCWVECFLLKLPSWFSHFTSQLLPGSQKCTFRSDTRNCMVFSKPILFYKTLGFRRRENKN